MIKNKIYATVMLLLGWILSVLDQDGTSLLVIGAIAIPAFFSKEDYFV